MHYLIRLCAQYSSRYTLDSTKQIRLRHAKSVWSITRAAASLLANLSPDFSALPMLPHEISVKLISWLNLENFSFIVCLDTTYPSLHDQTLARPLCFCYNAISMKRQSFRNVKCTLWNFLPCNFLDFLGIVRRNVHTIRMCRNIIF